MIQCQVCYRSHNILLSHKKTDKTTNWIDTTDIYKSNVCNVACACKNHNIGGLYNVDKGLFQDFYLIFIPGFHTTI